jgi:hypothetical protein
VVNRIGHALLFPTEFKFREDTPLFSTKRYPGSFLKKEECPLEI